jgi:hypothetical protein
MLTVLFCLFTLLASSQNAAMADAFRDDGKIYVVVAVIAVIFVSLVVFLIYLDRKIGKVERRLQERKENLSK